MKPIFLLIAFLCALSAGEITGKVVKVTDDDTITVLTADNVQVKVRLDGIDASESKQAYGQKSKENLSDLYAGKNASVQDKGQDRYKRALGVVMCEGINVNEKQVTDGYAWAYVKYSKEYIEAEKEAKDAKKGLWQDKNPIAPWDYRTKKKLK